MVPASTEIIQSDSAVEDIIYDVLSKPAQAKVIDNLLPHGTFIINVVDEPKFVDLLCDMGGDHFIACAKKAIFRIIHDGMHKLINVEEVYKDLCVRLSDSTKIKLHDISPDLANTPITFSCEIIGVDDRKVYIKEAIFSCPNCYGVQPVKCGDDRKIIEPYCDSKNCKSCKMHIEQKSIKMEYIQTLLLQEPMDESVNNSPIMFVGKIKHIDVGTVFPGQRKELTAMFKIDINDPRKHEHNIILDIVGIKDMDEDKKSKPTDDEVVQYTKDAKKPEFMDMLIDCFAPNIYGMRDIKKAILLQLAGGIKTDKRGEINILLVGDPSMAKSEILKFGKSVTPKSIYASGKGSSAAGLTAGMVKLPNGTSIARLGVYPLCHNGHAFIDEFDKMNVDDRSGMHEAMEQGTVSLAKAGVNMTVPAVVSTLAAANPIYGKYDPGISLAENIDLPPPLLSRFDLVFLVVDKIDDISDTYKARHVLSSYIKTDAHSKVYLNKKKLSEFLNYVRDLRPVLSKDAGDKLLELYKKMRGLSKVERNAIPVGIRQLEAIVRLSMAHAKILFKSVVEIDDVLEVIDVFRDSYKSFGIDIETGKFSQMTLTGVTEEDSKEQIALRVWESCKNELGTVDCADFVQKLTIAEKHSDKSATRLWRDWSLSGKIHLALDGRWKID